MSNRFSRGPFLIFSECFLFLFLAAAAANGQTTQLNIMITGECSSEGKAAALFSGTTLRIDAKDTAVPGFNAVVDVAPGTHRFGVFLQNDPTSRIVFIANNGVNRGTFHPDSDGFVNMTVSDQQEPWEIRISNCAEERLPVIFIPGVAGTALTTGSGIEVWPLSPARRRADMGLNPDGQGSANGATIGTGDILRREPKMNFYGSLMTALEKLGYEHGRDLFILPYDWRLSNELHFPTLDSGVSMALEKSKKKKVILVAHSMGGLIARAYIHSSAERASTIDSIITMGTPFCGSPKVYYGLTSGYTFGNHTVDQRLMKILLQNYPAAYQLLPQRPFIRDAKTKNAITLEESNSIRYKWFKSVSGPFDNIYDETEVNERTLNDGLLKMAKKFYALMGGPCDGLSYLPPTVKHYIIIGTGVKTLTGFEIEDWYPGVLPIWPFTKSYVEIGNGRKVSLRPRIADGDGTVPLWSLEPSLTKNVATAFYYVPYKWGFVTDVSSAHGDLPANPEVQSIIAGIIKRNPPDVGKYPRPQQYMDDPITPGTEVEDVMEFEIHSDAHLRITNSKGKILGFNAEGMIEESLPGTFLAYEGIEYAAVKQGNTPINVAVEGIRTGRFTLNVRARTGAGQVKEIRYNEVPVELGTLATLTFTPLSAADPPKLMVNTGGVTTAVEPKIGSANERPETPSAPPAGPAEIPSVRGTVGSFRFFSGDGENITPLGLRKYDTNFPRGSMKAIYFELTVNYADIDNSANFNLTAVWTRDGKPFARQDVPMAKPANWNIGTKTYGYGFPNAELWQPGTYTVELTVEGKRIAIGTFVVN